MRLLYILFLLAAATLHAELIPAARLTTWTPGTHTGVPGGIPTTRTNIVNVVTAGADNTGVTDCASIVQGLVNARTAGDIIYFPAGTYKIGSVISVGGSTDEITFRGAGWGFNGAPTTTINLINNAYFSVSGSSSYLVNPTISSGISLGSTSVVVASNSLLSHGQLAFVMIANDPDLPMVSLTGYDLDSLTPINKQLVRITNISGTTITFSPALYDAYTSSSLGVQLWGTAGQCDGVGFEDMAIVDSDNSCGFGIKMDRCYGSWIKNVKIQQVNAYPIALADSLQCEVRESFIDRHGSGGSNGAGILTNSCAGLLIENNVIYDTFPGIEVNFGTRGSVYAYNHIDVSGLGNQIAIDTNHGPHNMYNLYEGNVIKNNLTSDGYSGGASRDTIFRNWSVGGVGFYFKRFTREYNVVGNVMHNGMGFGEPNMGNSSSSGTADFPSDPWVDYYRLSNNAGTLSQTSGSTTVTTTATAFVAADFDGDDSWLYIFYSSGALDAPMRRINRIMSRVSDTEAVVQDSYGFGVSGVTFKIVPVSGPLTMFQEIDLDVETSTIDKGNRRLNDGNLSSLGGDTLPDSLYLSSKPSWFGSITWPPFDPATQTNTTDEAAMTPALIPAGYRYINGNESYLGGSVPTAPSALSATAISSTQINLTWTDNADDETSFRLERKVGAGAWSTVTSPAANATSYNNTGLSASTTYDYRIYAVNASGDSTVSNTASATTSGGGGGGGGNATIQTLNVGTLNIQ